MKKSILLFMAVVMLTVNSWSQEKPKALILNFQTEGLFATTNLAASIVRIELDKTKRFSIYEKTDINDVAVINNIKLDECSSAACIITTGTLTKMDKVLTGSMIKLGNKIVITIKMFDIKTGNLEKTQVEEFVNIESELQNMVHITILKMFDETPKKELVETLSYFQNISDLPTTKINNNGPRMGLAYMGGGIGSRFTAPESEGGYDAFPLISQFGYQFEAQYLSAGDLQALAEFLFIVGGLDQQLFIPSLVIMNGFRLNNSGWEVAFGPSFGMTRKADGYYDENKHWNLGYPPQTLDPVSGSYSSPYTTMENIDSRGNFQLTSSWVWGFGKTFRSGYLNIPVNVYFSKNKAGWYSGISCGFNIRKKEQKVKVNKY
jgi:hypothetical protein